MQGGKRKSIRLKGYDYSQPGMYFLTICSYDRKNIFGEVVKEEMIINELGKIIKEEWYKSLEIRKEIELDKFVIMPNHLHGIITIKENSAQAIVVANGSLPEPVVIPVVGQITVGGRGVRPYYRLSSPMKPKSISSFVAGFKSAATSRINIFRNSRGMAVWQSNYYEHIIRNEKSLSKIRNYILNNPYYWDADIENLLNKNYSEKHRQEYYKNLFII